jgi:hypothetical protein
MRNVVAALDIGLGWNRQLARKVRYADWNAYLFAGRKSQGPPPALPIQTNRRRHAAGEPVQRHSGQNFVPAEAPFDVAVGVAPAAKLIDYPCGKTYRRVVERGPEGVLALASKSRVSDSSDR